MWLYFQFSRSERTLNFSFYYLTQENLIILVFLNVGINFSVVWFVYFLMKNDFYMDPLVREKFNILNVFEYDTKIKMHLWNGS